MASGIYKIESADQHIYIGSAVDLQHRWAVHYLLKLEIKYAEQNSN
jgi:predicted GIY-YIG superfamily endonuclease